MSIDSLTRGAPVRYVPVAALLGVADLAASRVLRPGPVTAVATLLLALAILAVTALAGAAAGRRGERPGWAGALPGLAYGIVGGLGAFFQHETLAQARALLASARARAPITPADVVRAANAASTHLIQFLASALFLAIFGIVVGSLAGVFARRYMASGPRRVD